jgi:hypothetical protein
LTIDYLGINMNNEFSWIEIIIEYKDDFEEWGLLLD